MWEDIAFGYYIAGQADADSCFHVTVRTVDPKVSRFGVRVEPTWGIGKVLDREILEKIRDFLGVGKVYGPFQPDRYNRQPTFRLAVYGKACARIVEFFEKFPLRANKRKDFELWKKAVEIYCGRTRHKRPWTKEELLAMIEIRKQMDKLERAKKGRKQGIAHVIERLQSL